ncbi:MAG: hypothetical protein U0X20_00510 [Caldilineaceae bacterium]
MPSANRTPKTKKAAPAPSQPKRKGCLGRLIIPIIVIVGGCMLLGVIFAALQSAGESVGLLPTRTPKPTATITYTPSPAPTATETPIPTPPPAATATTVLAATAVPATSTPSSTLPPPPLVQRSETVALATAPPPVAAAALAPFTVGGWNVGLDDANVSVIADLLGGYQGVDVWGLAEVSGDGKTTSVLEQAAEAGEPGDFASVLGTSGDNMRLLALYDASRFDLLGEEELNAVNTTGNARAPLVLHLREKSSGQEFLFMVNHLYRSRDDERIKQAQLLAQWAATQTLPVIAVGDYNFDWEVEGGESNHDRGYDAMTQGGAWEWVRPQQIVTTECSGWPCTYDSVLDFVFTGGPARDWPARSVISTIPGDFPDDTQRSDHRAVLAEFAPGGEAELAGEIVTVPQAMPAGLAAAASQAAPTAAPPPPAAVPSLTGNANLRGGPGTEYQVVGGAEAGQRLEGNLAVIAQSADGQWLALANGAWISLSLVTGAPSGLAVADAPTATTAPAAEPAAAAPAPTAPARAAIDNVAPNPGASGSQWPEYTCEDNPSPPPNLACPIKGNISSEHIYHMPGQRDYCKTVIDESAGERWFCSPEEAEAAGWRAAKR